MLYYHLKNYLSLPNELTEFESRYLRRMNRIADLFFLIHIPLLSLLAFFNATSAGLAFLLSSITATGPLAARFLCSNPRNVSIVHGVTSMFMGALLVHFGQGPVQIEMHFYFFVLLALLAVFANPMVIVAAALTVAAHHAVLWFLLPSSVFNYAAPIWVVGVHALFVVLESVAACFIARSFFDNVIGLERKVSERTFELEARNEAMRRILDTIDEGMFAVDLTGRVGTELSMAAEVLLGPLPDSRLAVDWLGGNDQSAADWLLIGLDEVSAGIMPLEITLDQLPKRCSAGARTLSIDYSPLFEDGQLSGLTVVVRDITAEVTRERLEAENREMLAIIDQLSSDKEGFVQFFEEADGLVEALKSENRDDRNLVTRRLHTLKGNCSIFGLDRFASSCHHLETIIAEEGAVPANAQWTQLFGAWATIRGHLRRMLAEHETGIEVSDEQYQAFLIGILNEESKQRLIPMLAKLAIGTN
ncbi:MAG: Hpt domain-containing protein [Pirellulales bacterium]